MVIRAEVGVEPGVHQGGHLVRLEVLELRVDALEHRRRAGVLEGVGPHDAAHPAHHHRGLQPVAGDVADDEAERRRRAGGTRRTSHHRRRTTSAATKRVAISRPATFGHPRRQQAALHDPGRLALGDGPVGGDGDGDAVGRELDERRRRRR